MKKKKKMDLQAALLQVLLFVPVGKRYKTISWQKTSRSAIHSTSFTNIIPGTVTNAETSLQIQLRVN